MFYSQFILSKKTPLGRIWMAAHDRRLTAQQIHALDIVKSVGAPQRCVSRPAPALTAEKTAFRTHCVSAQRASCTPRPPWRCG